MRSADIHVFCYLTSIIALNYLDLCINLYMFSDAYKRLCPGGPGFRPNTVSVLLEGMCGFVDIMYLMVWNYDIYRVPYILNNGNTWHTNYSFFLISNY